MAGAAAYDTLRRSLGLSELDCAEYHQVKARTIRNWCRDSVDIEGPMKELATLSQAIENAEKQAIENAKSFLRPGDGEIALFRYRTRYGWKASPHASSMPFGAHAILIKRAYDALAAEGFTVRIEWAD